MVYEVIVIRFRDVICPRQQRFKSLTAAKLMTELDSLRDSTKHCS